MPIKPFEILTNAVRAKEIVTVLARNGFADLLQKLDLPPRLLNAFGKSARLKLNQWQRIRMVMEELGPTFIKVGQLLSMRPDVVPEALILELRKLLHLLGYHVPSYEVAWVRPAQFREVPPELAPLLEARLEEGGVRVSTSRLLEGEVLGPARFARFRDCAEVRALRVAFAWLNNIDAKDHNTLLVWDGTRTQAYLIDFGTSLGADAGRAGPKTPCAGWTHAVDLGAAMRRLLTLGLVRPRCDASPVASPSVGRFTAHFDPEGWKPYVPNVAFQQMNEDDARWMARRLARVTRAQIEAAVSAGRYARRDDAAYLTDTLDARRRIIVRHYLEDGG